MKEMMVAKDAREAQGGGFVRQEHSPQIGRGFTTKNPLIRMNINPYYCVTFIVCRVIDSKRVKLKDFMHPILICDLSNYLLTLFTDIDSNILKP